MMYCRGTFFKYFMIEIIIFDNQQTNETSRNGLELRFGPNALASKSHATHSLG